MLFNVSGCKTFKWTGLWTRDGAWSKTFVSYLTKQLERVTAGHLRVAVIKERLQFLARERAATGIGLELRGMHDQIALINDLLRYGPVPAVAGRAHG